MKVQWKHPLLAAAIAGVVCAQDPPRGEDQPKGKMTSTPVRCLASKLIGCDVKNSKGENLGEIEEVVLDHGNRRIAYAVLSFGGFLGLGEKYFAIPWRLVELRPLADNKEPDAILQIDKDVLKNAPGFDKKNWPDMGNPAWATQVDEYYRKDTGGTVPREPAREPGATVHDPKSKEFQARRLSSFVGADVVDTRNKDLGEIEDLVVDANRASVDAALLAYGGVLGIGEKQVLVPFEALTWNREKKFFVLPVTRIQIEAASFPSGKMPALHDDAWLTRARDQFGKPVADVPGALTDRDKPEKATAEEAAAELNALFADAYDVKKVETVKGTISTIGSLNVAGEKEERVRLRIHTDEGRDVIVYAGPWSYAEQQALALRAGQVVEVTGSPARSGRQTVLVAGTLKVDGKTVKLRDDQGRPTWRSDLPRND